MNELVDHIIQNTKYDDIELKNVNDLIKKLEMFKKKIIKVNN